MANKTLIFDTQVNTAGLDKAQQKLGELKDLGRGLKIQYGIDGKPLEVVIDKSKNLQQQLRLVTAELRRTKEGTAEFELLAKTQGDIQDALTRTKAKSQDLLGSLQLLPGPVGDFASKINGAISALKLFTSFSVKDIAFQFKELNGDLNDIIQNIFGVGGAAKEAKAELADTASTLANTGAETQNTQATLANAKAQNDSAISKEKDIAATKVQTLETGKQTKALIEQNIAHKELNIERLKQLENQVRSSRALPTEVAMRNADTIAEVRRSEAVQLHNARVEKQIAAQQLVHQQRAINTASTNANTIAQTANTTSTEANTTAEVANAAATKTDTVAKEANAAATEVATTANKGFLTSLKAFFTSTLGIITVIGLAVVGIYKWATATKELTKEQQTLKDVNDRTIKDSGDLISKFELLNNRVKQGNLSQREKTEITNQYNKELGDTLGKVKSYDELETKLISNGPKYLEYINLKAKADAAYALSVDVNKQIIEKGLADPSTLATFYDVWSRGGILGFFYEGREGTGKEIQKETIKQLETTKGQLQGIFQTTKDAAEKLAKELKIPLPKIEGLTDTKTIQNDNQKATDLLLKLKQEQRILLLAEERKKQDEQLKIDKENEEREVKNLKLSKDKEELRGQLLEQIRKKYGLKVIELNKKRQEEDNKIFDDDQKKLKEYQDKVFEIINNADQNELSKAKATRTKKFEDDKKALQADTNFQAQSLEQKIAILLALIKGYYQDLQKLDDDDAEDKRTKNLKKLEEEVKFIQLRGEAIRKGTLLFYQNQRDLLKAAEKREIADLEDRAIKEKLTEEQIGKEKLAIKQKYLQLTKQVAQDEKTAIIEAAQATLSFLQNSISDYAKYSQLKQQIELEDATERYIAQNEFDKKTITNQIELEKKLAKNKEDFAKEEDAIKKKAFEENKKIQIAQAIIATLQSAVGAYSSLIAVPFVGPVLAPVAAAAALVFGYKQVGLIKKTEYQSPLALSQSEQLPQNTTGGMANYGRNYEKGGMIGGRRHAEGGTIIEAEKGEAIMTRGAVANFGPLLSLMNQAGGGVAFNSNLLTTRQDAPAVKLPAQEQNTPIFKTYVVSQELTTEAQRQARLKNLSVI